MIPVLAVILPVVELLGGNLIDKVRVFESLRRSPVASSVDYEGSRRGQQTRAADGSSGGVQQTRAVVERSSIGCTKGADTDGSMHEQ